MGEGSEPPNVARDPAGAGSRRTRLESVTNEPRDDREVQTGIELRTPSWMPGITLSFNFKRTYEKRALDFVESVANLAAESPESLGERIAAGDRIADLFSTALPRAVERGDQEYVDVLAGLVAAGLIDDAKFDESAYLAARIVRLEPVHIRVLALLDMSTTFENLDQAGDIDISGIAEDMRLSEGVVENCLRDIEDVGFLVASPVLTTNHRVTNLGRAAIVEIVRIKTELLAKKSGRNAG